MMAAGYSAAAHRQSEKKRGFRTCREASSQVRLAQCRLTNSFEASHACKMKRSGRDLTIIEVQGQSAGRGHRYGKAVAAIGLLRKVKAR